MSIQKTFELKVIEHRKDGGRIIINTGGVDRDRDRVLPMGARIDSYLKNPVVIWGHDYRSPWATIGKTTKLEVSPEGVIAEFELRPAANEQDPQHIIRLLWEGNWIRTASIGFMPSKAKPNDVGGTDFDEWELLEFSLIPVPSNQDALRLAAKALDETPEEIQLKPFPHEHACRLIDPDKFEPRSFRRLPRENDGKKYDVIMGRLKGEEALTEQAFRYPKDEWQEREARAHCKDHSGILFEPASEKGRGGKDMHEHLSAAMDALESCREHLSAMADIMPEEENDEGKALEQKRGRVLSAKNEQRLRAARDALDEVLVQLDEAPEVNDDGKSKSETSKSEVPKPQDELARLFQLDANGERDLADSLRTLLTSLKEVIQ